MNEIRHGRTRLNQAEELLSSILSQTRTPADRIMDQYFRERRQMGSKDRAFAAETVYGCLRRKGELEALAAPIPSATLAGEALIHWLVATYLLKYSGWSARALADAGFEGDADALVTRVRSTKTGDLPFSARINMPDWLAAKLVSQYGEAEAVSLSDALNHAAQVGLRVNTLRANRGALAAKLAEEGHPCEPMKYSPVGLQRAKRGPLFNTQAFQEGLFELQDEGSQLLAYLTEAAPKEKVMDFCAGAGGKALALAAMMQNTGVLYACDISAGRLERLKPRLARAGAYNAQSFAIRDERDPALKKLEASMDAVLVDAPCSGTGTLRRNPDIKWRPIDLDLLATTQASILEAAAKLVKAGGRLIYATCSLLREENEAITEAFLAAHPEFQAIPAAEILGRQGVTVPEGQGADGALRLLPHRHGTDGFYALTMRRRTVA
ncbi:MAG TPA: RsmB/NOP family class I SAM-dependent RNA methyltransferase [Gammaproteobacteria bacterium]|nr:RsmB/NOP family class I SAM-dependent RNA methyltransferase [Gammaproteobacteria bacterium]